MATLSQKRPSAGPPPRAFGPGDPDAYWAGRRQRAAVGEASIHRRLAELVERYAPPRTPLLSCGAGEGHVMRLCSPHRRVYGVELSAEAIARYDFPFQEVKQADLNQGVPNFPEPFGAIVASWLLHWLDSPLDFLRSARERLAPGGVVIVNIPNITHYRYRLQMLVGWFPAISPSHRNFQTPCEVEATIRQAGLAIVRRAPAKATLRTRLRPTLLARDIIYVARADDSASTATKR